MTKKYTKGECEYVSAHFTSIDLDCKCTRPECKETLVDEDLCEALDLLWEESGPFKINSGFRCASHNAEIGGEKNSQHLLGKAADCQSLTGLSGNALARYAEEVYLFQNGGIGIAATWVHLDVRDVPARWSYPIPHRMVPRTLPQI